MISGREPGPHKIQGIGAGLVPPNLDLSLIDEVERRSTNEEAIEYARPAHARGHPVGYLQRRRVLGRVESSARLVAKGCWIEPFLFDAGER